MTDITSILSVPKEILLIGLAGYLIFLTKNWDNFSFDSKDNGSHHVYRESAYWGTILYIFTSISLLLVNSWKPTLLPSDFAKQAGVFTLSFSAILFILRPLVKKIYWTRKQTKNEIGIHENYSLLLFIAIFLFIITLVSVVLVPSFFSFYHFFIAFFYFVIIGEVYSDILYFGNEKGINAIFNIILISIPLTILLYALASALLS